MPVPRFHLQQTAVLVVDVQEKLLPHMHNAAVVEQQVGRLIDGANALKVPVLVTEQYRKGLGVTVPGVAAKLGSAVCSHEKLKFSACIEPVREELGKRGVRTVLVCGIEAHVCVLQTCLDLTDYGFVAAVAVDAIGSRKQADQDAAVQREIVDFIRCAGLKVQLINSKSKECMALETDPRNEFVRQFMSINRQTAPAGVDFFSDAAIIASGGIPSVVFGPGNIAQAHTIDEWISVRSLERATNILIRFLRALP